MNILESINNPIENESFLQKIVSLYTAGRIKSSEDLYQEFVINGKEPYNESALQYEKKFKQFTLKKSICDLLSNIGYSQADVARIWNSCCENGRAKDDNLKSEVLDRLWDKQLLAIGMYDPRDSLEEIIAENIFSSPGSSSMGYHVNSANLGKISRQMFKYGDEIKLYINVGADTYEFASKFEEKCKEQNLDYYYKVVRPEISGNHKNEWQRKDKLCIYSSLKDLSKFLALIQQVARENPNLDYRSTSELTGSIDNFIGIGEDPISDTEKKSSYSTNRCDLIFEALSELAKEKSNIDITSLKAKIIQMQKKYPDVSKSEFALSSKGEKYLSKVERPLVRTPKLKTSSFAKFSKLKKLYQDYILVKDTSTKEYLIKRKSDGEIIHDKSLINEHVFISFWCYVSNQANEKDPFDEKHRKCYEELVNSYIQGYNYSSIGNVIDHFTEESDPKFNQLFFKAPQSPQVIRNFIVTEISKSKTKEITTGVVKNGVTISKVLNQKINLKNLFNSFFKSDNSKTR